MNKKTKTIFWILFVLLIINLSALITIFFEVNKMKSFEENRDFFRNNNRCNFKEQLNKGKNTRH
jgi:regulatory protein YycI of two-component signal transduction system YycFG